MTPTDDDQLSRLTDTQTLLDIAWAALALAEALEGEVDADTVLHARLYALGKKLAIWQGT